MYSLSKVKPGTESKQSTGVAVENTCGVCERSLADRASYAIEGVPRCLRCTVQHRPLLRRSGVTALVVGTILAAINQGPELAAGILPAALLWKIPLTYLVPFCVATWGALSNSRRRTRDEPQAPKPAKTDGDATP
jgi:hypothetical protein